MSYPVDDEKKVSESLNMDDRQLVSQIIGGNNLLAALFLKQKCHKIFEYINSTRLKGLDLNVDDLINDFYLYLQENNWEKLRSFRYESKLQTWINLVASRYLLKKYDKDLKENARKGTQIDGFPSFTDDDHHNKMVRTDLLEAIGQLKEKRDQLVLLLILQGFDSSEIAEQVGTSIGNVYTIKSRAIEKLRTLLNE